MVRRQFAGEAGIVKVAPSTEPEFCGDGANVATLMLLYQKWKGLGYGLVETTLTLGTFAHDPSPTKVGCSSLA